MSILEDAVPRPLAVKGDPWLHWQHRGIWLAGRGNRCTTGAIRNRTPGTTGHAFEVVQP
jgi:hypothetical protein